MSTNADAVGPLLPGATQLAKPTKQTNRNSPPPDAPYYCSNCTKFIAARDTNTRTHKRTVACFVISATVTSLTAICYAIVFLSGDFGIWAAFAAAFNAFASYVLIRSSHSHLWEFKIQACPTCNTRVFHHVPHGINAHRIHWLLTAAIGTAAGIPIGYLVSLRLHTAATAILAMAIFFAVVYILRSRVFNFWTWFMIFGPAVSIGTALTMITLPNLGRRTTTVEVALVAIIAAILVGPLIGFVAAITAAASEHYRPAHPQQDGPQCPRCGYSLIGAENPLCPECGMDFSLLATVPQEDAWYPGCHKHETSTAQETNEGTSDAAPQPEASPQ